MSYFVYVFRSARGRLPALRAALITATVVASSLTLGASAAFADPSADDWARLRMCESSGNYAINTGNGYYGAYQFNIGTWEWMGGTGLPSDASPAEQDYRALKLYRINGWGPWPACTKKLGLVNDADAKSKVIPPDPGFAAPSTAPASTTAAPKKPAKKPKPTTSAPATTSSAPVTSAPATTAPATTAPATTAPATTAPATTAPKKKKKATSTATAPSAPTTQPPAPPTTEPTTTQPAAPTAAAKKRRADAAVTARTPEADAPQWSGQQYFPGDYSEDLKIWQQQAAALGYGVIPTGYFGPKTEQAARDLQRRGGLTPVGYIGRETWASAWSTDPDPGSVAGQTAAQGR